MLIMTHPIGAELPMNRGRKSSCSLAGVMTRVLQLALEESQHLCNENKYSQARVLLHEVLQCTGELLFAVGNHQIAFAITNQSKNILVKMLKDWNEEYFDLKRIHGNTKSDAEIRSMVTAPTFTFGPMDQSLFGMIAAHYAGRYQYQQLLEFAQQLLIFDPRLLDLTGHWIVTTLEALQKYEEKLQMADWVIQELTQRLQREGSTPILLISLLSTLEGVLNNLIDDMKDYEKAEVYGRQLENLCFNVVLPWMNSDSEETETFPSNLANDNDLSGATADGVPMEAIKHGVGMQICVLQTLKDLIQWKLVAHNDLKSAKKIYEEHCIPLHQKFKTALLAS
ncbi:hypothetical protein RFI_19919, partial [Reticulomyxa filosa]